MKNYARLRWLYAFCHLVFLASLPFGTFQWWLISLCTYLFLQIFGVGIGIHRYLAHRSFETGKWRYRFLMIVATLAAVGSPLSWAALHRYHHQTSDTDLDPHSFRHLGVWNILTGTYNQQVVLPKSVMRDLVSDKFLIFVHRNYFLILLLWALALALLGLKFFIFVFCVPVVLVYWANAVGIILNHKWGYRNFETQDHSVNSWILSLYTLGDGWHNNHHRHAQKFSHKVRWWEFDACALIIQYCLMTREEWNSSRESSKSI